MCWTYPWDEKMNSEVIILRNLAKKTVNPNQYGGGDIMVPPIVVLSISGTTWTKTIKLSDFSFYLLDFRKI